MKPPTQPTIVVDTREPREGSWEEHFTVPTVRKTLVTGDYSIMGCEGLVAIERKTVDDLIGCLTQGRERFTRELRRAAAMESFRVIVEATYQDILMGRYWSRMPPKAAWSSIIALQERYSVPFYFPGDPATAAELAEGILTRWWKEHRGEQVEPVPWEVFDSRLAQAMCRGY